MNAYESISKSSKTLTYKEPYYGLLLLSLNKSLDKNIPTAGVSKKGINHQLTINPDFWMSLSDSSKVGVLKHELLHIAMFHLFMRQGYPDWDLFNIAADLEVNQYIQPEFKGSDWHFYELSTFPELNLPPKAGTKKYYELLQKAIKDNTSPGLASNYQNMKDGNGVLHELWKVFSEMSEVEQRLFKTQIEYQLKEVAKQVKSNRGLIPGELEDIIKALFEVHEPVINWRAYIRQFAGISKNIYTRKTRRKESKRIKGTPGLKIKKKQHIVFVRDTSGSVSDIDLREFDNEMLHIYRSGTSVTVIDCDAGIKDIWEFKGKIKDSVKGRGGTRFEPAIEYVNKNHRKYDSIIYLTDGECPAPSVKSLKKILWVISSKGTTSYAEDYPFHYVQINR
jgi:predicted metal-dependent peptidase